MSDKIVTHADLGLLRDMERTYTPGDRRHEIIVGLIHEAEADASPLPEPEGIGSVVRATCVHDDTPTIFVKRESDSWIALPGQWDRTLQQQSDCWDDLESVEVLLDPDRLTPLRPSVTEAQVSIIAADLSSLGWPGIGTSTVRVALGTAGIEVVQQ